MIDQKAVCNLEMGIDLGVDNLEARTDTGVDLEVHIDTGVDLEVHIESGVGLEERTVLQVCIVLEVAPQAIIEDFEAAPRR